jgi:hypothetical protein
MPHFCLRGDRQRQSRILEDVVGLETIPLPLRTKRALRQISVADIAAIKHLGQACAKCAEWGGLSDKVVALETGIDAGLWSRIKSNQAHPSGEFLDLLMDAAGNETPMLWLVYRRGYDPATLRRLESEMERELRETREELTRLLSQREVEVRLMRELRA